MYFQRPGKIDWSSVYFIADLIAFLAAGTGAAALLSVAGLASPAFVLSLRYTVGQTLFQMVCSFLLRRYRSTGLVPPKRRLRLTAAALLEAAVLFAFLLWLLSGGITGAELNWLLADLVLALLLSLGLRRLLCVLLSRTSAEPQTRRLAVAGWSFRLEQVLKSLQEELGDSLQSVGYLEVNQKTSDELKDLGQLRPLGHLDDVGNVLAREKIDLLLVDSYSVEQRHAQRIASACAQRLVDFRLIPSSFDIWSTRLSVDVVAGVPLLGFQELRHRRLHNRIVKRAFDLVGGMVGLLLAGPIMAICSRLIKRESPGPVIYKQPRVGLDGNVFTLYKLRSMKLNADKVPGANWTTENDPRRLKIGAFLRKTNIDETPQFWNVVKGDMSLVGPRPERPEFVQTFTEALQNYNLRHTIKPGMTGWAAIHGLRGNTSLADRLEYDLYYIENWSPWLDMKILLFTFLPAKNAY